MEELLRLQDQAQSHPRDVYEAARAVLKERPAEPIAHALAVASLYWMDRPKDLAQALEDAKAAGVDARPFGAQRAIRDMMDAEHAQHRLPPQVMDQLKAYLPPPPGDRPERKGDRW
jgi:uncharacterized protein with von Willebrand factor type A (vWA) domain